MRPSMAAADTPLRDRIAARASEISGVDATAIRDDIAPDGSGHHAASKQVGAAIDEAITECRQAAQHRL